MSELLPVVRYLILCEDVQTEPAELQRVTLVGLLSAIRSVDDPPYPLLYQELCAFLQLSGCRGIANGRIEVRHADSDRIVYRTQERAIPFSTNPLEVVGVVFRLRDCLFREPGLYWVQFWYNQAMLVQQPLV